jgi:hypothetical protein
MGAAACGMERRGIRTERGNKNREIEITNKELRQLKARINKLRDWLKEEMEKPDMPTLAEVFESMLNLKQQKGQFKQVADLKQAAKTFAFLQANNIADREGLNAKVSEVYARHGKVSSRLNAIDRRVKVLDEHIKHSGNYKAYRSQKAHYEELYSEYTKLTKSKGFGAERKAQKALDIANTYYESSRMEITLYEAAERHLKQHLNGRNEIPLPSWKKEREKLNAEKKTLYAEYHLLKSEVKEMEKIKWNVEVVMREEARDRQRQKSHGMEL